MAAPEIIYFTATFPYGYGEMWKLDELETLHKQFPDITIIPNSYGGNKNAVPLDAGLKVGTPLESEHRLSKSTMLQYLFFSKYSLFFWKEAITNKVFLSKKKLLSWYNATFYAVFLLTHPAIKKMLTDKEAAANRVLLFFWGKGSCEFIPFIPSQLFRKVIIKMHRYDLFEYLYDDYIPYRKTLLQKATTILPSHQEGLHYLQKKYPAYRDKIMVNRVGTKPSGKTVQGSTGDQLVIYSCSTLTKVKRVELMLEAAARIPFPFVWNHIGDGSLETELIQLRNRLGLDDKFNFLGFIKPAVLKKHYLENPVDLFVNTSASEGIPVSILEMLSLGVPVMATDVGSVREAVDESVGHLLPMDLTPELLASELEKMYRQIKKDGMNFKGNCVQKFNAIGNSDQANAELVKIILQ